LKLSKLVNLVCADERIAVAAQNTATMQAIFDRLRLRFLTFGEVVAAEVARSAVKIEFFIFVSLNDVVISVHLVTRQNGGRGVIPLR
jgi:hypothetical protein